MADGTTVCVADVMKATLSADRRVTDDAEAACYPGGVRGLLETARCRSGTSGPAPPPGRPALTHRVRIRYSLVAGAASGLDGNAQVGGDHLRITE